MPTPEDQGARFHVKPSKPYIKMTPEERKEFADAIAAGAISFAKKQIETENQPDAHADADADEAPST